jgi:hypothetical protein
MQNFYYFCTEILTSIDAQGWGWGVKEYDIGVNTRLVENHFVKKHKVDQKISGWLWSQNYQLDFLPKAYVRESDKRW